MVGTYTVLATLFSRWSILLLGCCLSAHVAAATPIKLHPHHPTTYTVQPGDTLWEVSAKFLNDPLEWPLLLKNNPQITDPFKLYPGQILQLSLKDGQPFLTIASGGTVKLKPQAQITAISTAIPAVPLHAIQAFLVQALVLDVDAWKKAPYIVAQSSGQAIGGQVGEAIYVEDLLPAEPGTQFAVFRQEEPFVDAHTGEILGYPALTIAKAELMRNGQPATLLITDSNRELLVGDRVLPLGERPIAPDYFPHVPTLPIKGRIISIIDGTTQIGAYFVVVINRGTCDGVQVGDLLGIYHQGDTIPNPVNSGRRGDPAIITLPNQRSGDLFIFRTFEKVSYGLVLRTTKPIHLLDLVLNPRFEFTDFPDNPQIPMVPPTKPWGFGRG